VPTADDDSSPVSHGEFKLPRALLNWDAAPRRGVAGRGMREELDTQPTPVSRRAPFAGSHAEARASSDAFDDDPTVAIPVVPHTPDRPDAPQGLLARGAVHLDAAFAHAVQLLRDRPLRTAAIVAGIALITYLAVDGARQRSNWSSQTLLTPPAAVRAAGPIIVEQLSETRRPGETVAAPLRSKRTDTPDRRSGRRARETPFAAMPASNHNGDQAIAPAQPKSGSAERSGTSVASSSAALPAWGAEATRDFSGATSNKPATVTTGSQALTARPAASSADTPPTMAASPPGPRDESTSALGVAAKLAEPTEPVAPQRPSTPLTMEQMLNQMEEAAQAQRKKAGLKASKSSERDAELDALISGAMKSSTGP
jgi:hypothetical protein